MQKLLTLLAVFGLGVVLGRFFDGAPPRAEAVGVNPLPPCQDINGDGRSDVSDAVFFLSWSFLGGPEPACPASNGQPAGLPDTGQTNCYDQRGVEILCDSATCPGQDGFYVTGCPSGDRFVDNGDGTVTDNCTGLMWQQDTADTNDDGQSTDRDYLIWCDATEYCENLSFAGHDDWRLPNVRELQSVVDYGRVNPSIDPVFGAMSSVYWSSTANADDPDVAWIVVFNFGFVDTDPKDDGLQVRAVRSAP